MTPARDSGSPRAPATLALGAALTLAGLAFGLAAALVAGIALLALALGAIAWVELATLGGRLERTPGPTRLEAWISSSEKRVGVLSAEVKRHD